MATREATNSENESMKLKVTDESIDEAAVQTPSSSSEGSAELPQESLDGRCVVEADLAQKKYPKSLETLYKVLVEPALRDVTQDEVVIIPDGIISMVPFAALRDPSTGLYLSETRRIRLAPSLTTLNMLQDDEKDWLCKTGALIIGDPDAGEVMFEGKKKTFNALPGAKREAETIGKLLNISAFTKSKATKERVMHRLHTGVAVIHIAAHGSTEGKIALAPSCTQQERKDIPKESEYILTMKDVQDSGARAQLVVLSCCHTGRGEIKAEGVVAMSRAFLAAGVRAVVASLWAVDDQATLKFMLMFYKYLNEGKCASRSLQLAMKEMRETDGYSEPKYWAPFFLIGDDVTVDLKEAVDTKTSVE